MTGALIALFICLTLTSEGISSDATLVKMTNVKENHTTPHDETHTARQSSTAQTPGLKFNTDTVADTSYEDTSLQLSSDSTEATITPEEKEEDNASWMMIFDTCQLIVILMGILVNLFTLITLFRNPMGFSRLILVLLRHQSLVDMCVCLFASILMLQPFMWLPGNHYLDILICQVWHGQALYWGAVTLSTYNLMLIACERFLAIRLPFKHSSVSCASKRRIAVGFIVLYLSTIVVTHGTYIQTSIQDGECVNEYAFDGQVVEDYFFGFVIFTYITTYCLPAVFMALLYGLIIRTLHTRSKDTTLGQSKVVDQASAALTKTAVTVTTIFIVTIGYDLHYYLLGYTGVTTYELNTPIQKVGVFLSNLNSVANPFVYALLMPLYRRSVISTLRCQKTSRMQQSGSANVSGSQTTVISMDSTNKSTSNLKLNTTQKY